MRYHERDRLECRQSTGPIQGFELTREHHILLRAMLGEGQAAIDAWKEWQQQYDLSAIDSEGYALLPQIYLRLRDLDARDAALAKLQGIYRHTWCKNQVVMTRAAGALSMLAQRGIECLLLDGTRLIGNLQTGLFPLERCDFLVPGRRFADATAAFRQAGWSQWSDSDHGTRLARSINFTQVDGTTCAIHRSVFAESTASWADEDSWRHAIPATVHNVSVSTLSPTDHLLRLLVDVGLGRLPLSPRWVADVGTLVNPTEGAIDWERLRFKCATLRLTLPVKRSVAALRGVSALRCPRALDDIAKTLVTTWAEHREDESRLAGPGRRRSAGGALAEHWCDYKRLVGETGRLPGFVRYLRETWEVPSVWLVPLTALGKWARQLGGTR
jgi:hypothetical protein